MKIHDVLIHLSIKKRIAFCVAACVAVISAIEVSTRIIDSKLHIASNTIIRIRQEVPKHNGPYLTLPIQVESEYELIQHRPFQEKNTAQDFMDDAIPMDLYPSELQNESTIFFLGGSTVHGAGVRSDQCFAALAQKVLPAFRIVNAGRNGFNSNGISLLAKTIMDHYQPSCLVVMSGNNEWLRWRWDYEIPLADQVKKSLSVSTGFLYLTHGIRSLRLQAASKGKAGPRFNPGHGCLRSKRVTERKAEKWGVAKNNYIGYFKHNLEQIASYAKRKKVSVIFCEVPYRLDLCPAYFTSQPANVLAAYKAAGNLDPNMQRKMVIEALRDSRALMCGNLGAMPEINEAIAQVAKRFNLPLIELQGIMENHIVDPTDFNRYFLDFCHLTDDGHKLVAQRIIPAINRILPHSEDPH